MNTLSALYGALFAVLMLAGAEQLLAQHHHTSFVALGWPGMVLFLAIAFVAAYVGRLYMLAALILARRPRAAVEWRRPSECASLREWVSHSWDESTATGRRQGHRAFGLGLAIHGEHAPRVAIPGRTTSN
jgi:hypothetical protein